jgi:hypothetical protein
VADPDERVTDRDPRPANNARFLFLDPDATEFFRDWDKVASDTVAMLRAEAGRDPYERGLSDLIGGCASAATSSGSWGGRGHQPGRPRVQAVL